MPARPGREDGEEGPSWLRLGLALVVSGQSMVFGLGYSNAERIGEAPDYGSIAYWVLHGALLSAALVVMILLGGPLIKAAWKALRARRITIDLLFVLSAAGALSASLTSTISGRGSVYYEVVSVVLFIYSLGTRLGQSQRGKALAAVRELQSDLGFARVEVPSAGRVLRKPVERVVVSEDLIRVEPGEWIPMDGTVTGGVAYVDEASVTGEPQPVVKRRGDRVFAGSVTMDGTLRMIAEVAVGQRRIDAVFRAFDSACFEPSRLQMYADRIASFFVPIVAAVALATFLFWTWALEGAWERALFYSMSVLLVACPCALGLATPMAVWGGLLELGRRGLVARTGQVIDKLARLELVVFDKTGTLTDSEAQLVDLVVVPEWEPQRQLLKDWIASLERDLAHPVARTLARVSDGHIPLTERRWVAGNGVEAICASGVLRLGEPGFAGSRSTELRRLVEESPAGAGHKEIALGLDGRVIAVCLLAERVRDQAATAIEALQQLGIAARILSGDPRPRLQAVAGCPVEAGLSPEQKQEELARLDGQGVAYAYVGDGINDAGSMAMSPLSIAMPVSAAVTRSTADAVLQSGDLSLIPFGVRLSRHLQGRLRGNLMIALAYNSVGIALAAAGLLHPVAAALIMLGSSLLVSYRALGSVHQLREEANLGPRDAVKTWLKSAETEASGAVSRGRDRVVEPPEFGNYKRI